MVAKTMAWVVLEILRSVAWPQHRAPEKFVFHSRDEMAKVWVADGGAAEQLPAVDFDKEIVVAVFSGQKNSGGYGIKIEGVYYVQNKLSRNDPTVILYREKSPEPGSMQTRNLNYPSDVEIVKDSGPHEYKFVDAGSDEGKQISKAMKR